MKKPILILFTVFFFSCETQEPILPELQTIDLEYFSDNGTSETISVQVVEDQGRINFLSNGIKTHIHWWIRLWNEMDDGLDARYLRVFRQRAYL